MQLDQSIEVGLQEHPWALRQVVLEYCNVQSRRWTHGARDASSRRSLSLDIPIAISENRDALLVRFRLWSADEGQPYDFDVMWSAEFRISPDATDEDIDQFGNTTGPFVLWPYIRTQIADLTSKMGFPPFLLPVVIFDQLAQAAEAEELDVDQPR